MKYAITIITLFTLFSCNAQTIKVTYSEKIDLSEKLKSIDNPMIKQMIIEKTGKPKYYELISSKGISIYQKHKNEEENVDNEITMIGGSKKNILYKNFNDKTFIKQVDFMSRTFLIEDKLQKIDWKMTEETQKIGEYLCRKAILKKGDNEIAAWFTNEIPSNDGPRGYFGLPGLILEIKTGMVTVKATNISISKEKAKIQKPSKGKKVTQKEFEKIRKEKMDELIGNKKQNGEGVQFIKM